MYLRAAILMISITLASTLFAQEKPVEESPNGESATTQQESESKQLSSDDDQWYSPVLDAGYQVLAGILVAILGVVGISLRQKVTELSQAKRKLQLLLPPTIDDPLHEANSRHLITAIFLGEANSGKSELIGSLIGSDKKRVRSETVNRHYGIWGTYYDPKDPQQNPSMETGAKAVRESYWLDLFDSVGQDFGQIIDFLTQTEKAISKHIVLVIVVDLFSGPEEEETLPIGETPEENRIKSHLTRFDEQFVEQFRGALGEIHVQQVIIFVNKVDGIRYRGISSDLKRKFRPVRQAFTKYGYPVKTIIGSALTGDGLVELTDLLRDSAEKIDD